MTVLVTGGAGFIGSAVVRHLIRERGARVVNLDKLTYAATPEALGDAADSPNYAFEQADICDRPRLDAILARHRPSAILHLAAESHVDRSIDGPAAFIETNLVGTFQLLEAARGYYEGLSGTARGAFRLHHVSTDEVFGSLGAKDPPFQENSRHRPNSPYAASKAGSDHLVRAWGETYGLPVLTSNCSNNYGPWQFPEKLIPVMIAKAADGAAMPVYGRGENVRDWLHVEDHAVALATILERGRLGETYNVGGASERRNIEVTRAICDAMDAARPEGAPHARLIAFVEDRPGHDLRYAIDAEKITRELGWRPTRRFEDGLRETVDWYLAHETWWRGVIARRTGAGDRLGLSRGRRSAP
ncbi:MAG: dTDP-glucose 4,6-dehydratase [Pseudomonadota bacterium]